MTLWRLGWSLQSKLAENFNKAFDDFLELGEVQLAQPARELEDKTIIVQFLHMTSCLEVCYEAMEDLADDEELEKFMCDEQSRTENEFKYKIELTFIMWKERKRLTTNIGVDTCYYLQDVKNLELVAQNCPDLTVHGVLTTPLANSGTKIHSSLQPSA